MVRAAIRVDVILTVILAALAVLADSVVLEASAVTLDMKRMAILGQQVIISETDIIKKQEQYLTVWTKKVQDGIIIVHLLILDWGIMWRLWNMRNAQQH